MVAPAQIDRKDAIHQCYWLTFPHQDGPEFNHSNTVLDGEFVIDVDPNTGQVRRPACALLCCDLRGLTRCSGPPSSTSRGYSSLTCSCSTRRTS